MVDPLGAARDEHAAAARRDHLVAVEGEGCELALAACGRVPEQGSKRLGGVLDERHFPVGADRAQGVVIAALAVEIDGDHRADLRPFGERALEERRVDRPGRLVGVDEDRSGTRVVDRVRARGECQRRAGDLVAGADSEHDQRQVERGGAAREGERVRHADNLAQLLLERVHVRPERCDPVGVDRVPDEPELAAGQVRRGEIDARHCARA